MEPMMIAGIVVLVIVFLILLLMFARRSALGMCKWTAGDNTLIWSLKTLLNNILIIPGLLGFVLNYTIPDAKPTVQFVTPDMRV